MNHNTLFYACITKKKIKFLSIFCKNVAVTCIFCDESALLDADNAIRAPY